MTRTSKDSSPIGPSLTALMPGRPSSLSLIRVRVLPPTSGRMVMRVTAASPALWAVAGGGSSPPGRSADGVGRFVCVVPPLSGRVGFLVRLLPRFLAFTPRLVGGFVSLAAALLGRLVGLVHPLLGSFVGLRRGRFGVLAHLLAFL